MLAPRHRASFVRLAGLAGLLCSALVGCGGGGGGSSEPTAENATNSSTPQSVTPAANPGPAQSLPESTVIRVLALYTAGIETRYPDPTLRIQHVFNVANDIVLSSALDLSFELAHLEPVTYPDGGDLEQVLDDLTYAQHPALNTVAQLRDSHAADLVTLFRPYTNDGRCGIAWVTGVGTPGDFSGQAAFGYSVIGANCSDYTLMHELGHNLGLAHSRREDPGGGSLPHGVGYGVDGEFATVMASPLRFSAPRLPRLSNPLQQCAELACGIPASNDAEGADATAAINASKDQIASFR
ncbi:MAG: M12 family metallo-peptidase [Pseudomonadales bacterium]